MHLSFISVLAVTVGAMIVGMIVSVLVIRHTRKNAGRASAQGQVLYKSTKKPHIASPFL